MYPLSGAAAEWEALRRPPFLVGKILSSFYLSFTQVSDLRGKMNTIKAWPGTGTGVNAEEVIPRRGRFCLC